MRLLSYVVIILLCISSCSKEEGKKTTAQKDGSGFFIDSLISVMTLEEKVGQLTLFTSGWDVTGPTLNDNYREELKKGRVGNIFNAHTVEYNTELQRMALETRLGIPLLFGYDVIHGHRTIFPIPLAEASSWDLELIEKSARLSAKEAAASGLNWTFNPMVDISRDPRWGRISEGSGEDPFLGSLIGAARVRGYQGDDLSDPLTILACVKHFAAYGAAQAGRDYHTVDMSERVLRQDYLPPYKAAIDAGVTTVMTSFNEVDGIPASGNKKLLTGILRDEWNFEGFIVTDYTSINEMVPHGFANDEREAARLAFQAGVDMDMQGGVYLKYLPDLVNSGEIEESDINAAVARILRMKVKLGLFDDPYRYLDAQREEDILYSAELMEHALDVARKSIVLLKNESYNNKKLLPVNPSSTKIALIGPMGNNQMDMMGSWHASGNETKVVTLLEGLKKNLPDTEIVQVEGASMQYSSSDGFNKAVRAASNADLVIMAIGENYQQSGEAASRSNIDLPGGQSALLDQVYATGTPVIAVVMAGRPLTIPWIAENIPAVINAWHLGTMGGQAIADVITGVYNPSGKLPVTFPRSVGQVPIYLSMKNTGRPYDENNKYTSKYLDIENTPLYPFGFGISYTTFSYSELTINKSTLAIGDSLEAAITVTNTGDREGEEVVQLYIRDLVGSVTRPVKELKGFKKIKLKAGESQEVKFGIDMETLSFYNAEMEWRPEIGEFEVYVGTNSSTIIKKVFTLTNKK